MENSPVRDVVIERAGMFADEIHEGDWKVDVQKQWDTLQLNVNLKPQDYVFILKDTDVLDDTRLIRAWTRELSGVAFSAMRYSMYEGDRYRVDGEHKPHYSYPLFPYVAGGTMVQYGGLFVPNYSLVYQYIQEPHLTILNYDNYEQDNDTTPTLKIIQYGSVV
jgi:hypothetical protein